jgi:hypothetical protein
LSFAIRRLKNLLFLPKTLLFSPDFYFQTQKTAIFCANDYQPNYEILADKMSPKIGQKNNRRGYGACIDCISRSIGECCVLVNMKIDKNSEMLAKIAEHGSSK